MRDEYEQAYQEAMRLLGEAKDACNHVVDVADESEENGDVYDWAHNAYHETLLILSDGLKARQDEEA